jgi:hypothetical protein
MALSILEVSVVDGKVRRRWRAGPAQSNGVEGDGYAPLVIPEGTTFTVPANRQVFYRLPIQVDGELIIEGELIEI